MSHKSVLQECPVRVTHKSVLQECPTRVSRKSLESRVFGVLDVAVPLGFAFQGVASKLCFRDKSQLKCRFWWMGVCSERVEIIPSVWCGANFFEAHMR